MKLDLVVIVTYVTTIIGSVENRITLPSERWQGDTAGTKLKVQCDYTWVSHGGPGVMDEFVYLKMIACA